jgi:acetyl-CoA carboxylase biotin carboxyl carrier protein
MLSHFPQGATITWKICAENAALFIILTVRQKTCETSPCFKHQQTVEIKEIRSLIDLMKKNGLAVFKMEKEGFKITLKTAGAGPTHIVTSAPAPAAAPLPVVASAAPAAAAPVEGGIEIKSPMVGTFYSAASPESPAFVSVGQEVTPDTVVCIVEAMKVMNEIKAEVSGVVTEVSAENGKPVQFGQTLFRLK